MDIKEIILGSVNFGMPYTIRHYKVPQAEVIKILHESKNNAMTIDTAINYNSEKIIGESYCKNVNTKLIPHSLPADSDVLEIILAQVKHSTRLLGVHPKVLYIHNENYIYHLGVISALVELKRQNYFQKIGISVYNFEIALLAAKMKFDVIQIPYSVFDQQLDKTDFFKIAKENNVQIQSRSAFLQGILLMKTEEIPLNIDIKVKKFENIAQNYGFSRVEAALLFNLTHPGIDKVIIGVDSLQQLNQDLEINHESNYVKFHACRDELKWQFNHMDMQIPSLWAKK